MTKSFVGLSLAFALAGSAEGQGNFQNLDFEAARILFQGSGQIAVSNALPGWAAFSGTSQLSTIPYNAFTIVPKVGLYGSNSSVISGSFGVSLSDSGSINQTGLVPVGSESLLFKGWWPSLSPSVSLGGQDLQFILLSNAPNYTLYGASIHGFAGQTATLAFSTLVGAHDVFIDDILFSPEAIPEPRLFSVLALAALLFGWQWSKMRKS